MRRWNRGELIVRANQCLDVREEGKELAELAPIQQDVGDFERGDVAECGLVGVGYTEGVEAVSAYS